MKIGYCAVTADILHEGHIRYINACKKFCDFLVVGVMSDEYIEEYKDRFSIFSEDARMFMVQNLKEVDLVVLQPDFNIPAYKDAHIYFDTEEHDRWKGYSVKKFPRFSYKSSTNIRKVIVNEDINNS